MTGSSKASLSRVFNVPYSFWLAFMIQFYNSSTSAIKMLLNKIVVLFDIYQCNTIYTDIFATLEFVGFLYKCIFKLVFMCVCIFECLSVGLCVCVSLNVCLCVYMCVCV